MINTVVSQDNNITKNKMKSTLSHLYPSSIFIFADTAIEKEDNVSGGGFARPLHIPEQHSHHHSEPYLLKVL